MSQTNDPMLDTTQVAQILGTALEQRGYEYAFGGAIALGY